jgi:uncharacterized membrane protein SpoIIM required for sporulation
MRETKFIAQKKAKWQELEGVLRDTDTDPDRLSDLFIQATDDLSYARTFYPNRSVRVYLNGLAQSLFLKIYQNKRLSLTYFATFFREELPDLMWHTRRVVFWATLAFVLLFLVGWVSSTYNPGFDKIILGEEYIRMTKANIAKGNPMGVYQKDDPIEMFFQIGINNVQVDFLTFVLGIFAGIGSMMLMIYNAVMVGVFQHFFWAHGGLKDSLFSIWVHGAFEISAMILSTVAGMEMGRGLLFPGTYSRLQAFQITARRGIKIFVGVLLITVIAAFNESFLTRYAHAPYLLRGTLILISFSFIFLYFVYYPYRRYKAGIVQKIADFKLSPDDTSPIVWARIKTTGELIKDTFILLQRKVGAVLGLAAAMGFSYAIALYAIVGGDLKGIVIFRNSGFGLLLNMHLLNVIQFLQHHKLPLFFAFANAILFTITNLIGNFWLLQTYDARLAQQASDNSLAPSPFLAFLQKNKTHAVSTFVMCVGLSALLYLPYMGLLLFFILLPTLQMWQFAQLTKINNPFRAFTFTIQLFQGGFVQILLLYVLFLGFSLLFTLLSSSQLMQYLLNFLQWNMVITRAEGFSLMRYILAGMTMFSYTIFLLIFKFGFAGLAASLDEQQNATSLLAQIAKIGSSVSLRGMAKE